MLLQLALLTGLFAVLPAVGQTRPQVHSTTPLAPAYTGYSREKLADVCTDAPRSEWLPEDEMKLLAQHRGYRIKTFKVANNSCYEVYGFDRNNRIVEAYFNPVTARLVRLNIAH